MAEKKTVRRHVPRNRSSRRKMGLTGAQPTPYRKSRKFELSRPPANTKLGVKRVHDVRVRGGNIKHRALRLDHGDFSWGTKAISRKARILSVVYNASDNELTRTNTLVKGSVIQIDATPFRSWYQGHYHVPLGKRTAEEVEKITAQSKHVQRKVEQSRTDSAVEAPISQQFSSNRLYAIVSSRPGQSGRCDGYILEGKELEFYRRKLDAKKHK